MTRVTSLSTPRFMGTIPLAAILFVLAGCAASPATNPMVRARYEAAVADARDAERAEIRRNLFAIDASNPDVVWEGAPGESRVLVVSWTRAALYPRSGPVDLPQSVYVWVTPAPLLARFCRSVGFSGDALALRIEQVLGLPPGSGKDSFVELWVDPNDIFRPCPDPEIDDRACNLGFPGDKSHAPSWYERWFRDLYGKSYGEGGYPWTRLGYTYDWGGSGDAVGLSEYVIDAGATVRVKSVRSTADFCR